MTHIQFAGATIALMIFTSSIAWADHPTPPCYEPDPNGVSALEYQRGCVRGDGVPRLHADVYCQLPDGVWVHNQYWTCEAKPNTTGSLSK